MIGAGSARVRRILPDENACRIIDALAEVQAAALWGEIVERPVLARWDALRDYLHARLAFLRTEQVLALWMDNAGRLITCEPVGFGTVDQSELWVRTIVIRGLDLAARGLILAHNHPSGVAEPTSADIAQTGRLYSATELVDLRLFDHIIVTRASQTSMRARGMI